jgi:hypothetical protein
VERTRNRIDRATGRSVRQSAEITEALALSRIPADGERRYKGIMKFITPISFVTLTLAFAACDSKQEQARKAALEARSDKLEEAAKATKKGAEADAEVVKKEGAAQAEALKNEADRVRDQK